MLPDDVRSGREGPAKGEHDVANLDERVISLEAQADKHADAVDGLRTEMAGLRTDLRGEMDALRTDLRGEMDALRTELRGDMAALRTELHGDMAALRTEMRGDMVALRTELRSDMAGLRTDLGEMSRGTDRFFIWLAGTQVATLLAVIGVLVGVLYR